MSVQSVADIKARVAEEIKVRKPKFDFSDVPRHYIRDNPVATHFVNAMQVIFPDGERFFIKYVQQFAKDIEDAELRERVKAFVAQEVQHGMAHEKFWDIMRQQGIPVDTFHKLYHATAYGLLEPGMASIFGDKMGLSVTAALEHYTATLAEGAFKSGDDPHAGFPEEMRYLMKWHAAEEIEHKSVAFDVLQEVDDSYWLRAGGFIVASIVLWSYAALGQAIFLAGDKEVGLLDLAKNVVGFFRGLGERTEDGLGKTLLEYLRRDFHPDDIDNRHLAENFVKEFEAEMKKRKVA